MHIRTCLILALSVASLGTAFAQTRNRDTAKVSTAATSDYADDAVFSTFQRVTKEMTPPREKYHPDPRYPDLPPDAEQSGAVMMLVGVSAQGRVEPVRVLRSSGAAFEKTAVDTVKKWKFKPAKKDGQPVPVQITVEMTFRR